MNPTNLNVLNDIAFFPASPAYLRPSYPLEPQSSTPVSEALGLAYGRTALTLLLALTLSFLFTLGAARFSQGPAHRKNPTPVSPGQVGLRAGQDRLG